MIIQVFEVNFSEILIQRKETCLVWISREFELSEFELTEYSCVNMTESWGEIQGNRTKFELAWSLSYPSSRYWGSTIFSFPVFFYSQLRREGARLFMLWFQALQENSDELCQLMYACMIPGFPNPIDNVEWKSKMSRAGAEEIFMSINESGYRDQPPSTSNLHLSSDRESDGWFCSHKIISTLMLQNTMYLSDIWL